MHKIIYESNVSFFCPKKGLPKHFNRVPCCMMILTLSRITNSAIFIILTIKHIYIYIKYCLNALFYFNICQLICIPYDISNVRHLLNAIQKYWIMRIIDVGRNHKSLSFSPYCCYRQGIFWCWCPSSRLSEFIYSYKYYVGSRLQNSVQQ